MPRCVVCCNVRPATVAVLCSSCLASYHRSAFTTGAVADAIEWAARRARYFAKKPKHGKRGGDR